MKVLEILDTEINYGGEAMLLLSILENVDRKKTQLDCMTLYTCENDAFRERLEACGGKLIELRSSHPRTLLRNEAFRPVRDFFKTCDDYDVVHIHCSGTAGLTVLSKAADLGDHTKIIVHSHANGVLFTMPYRFLRFIASFIMRRHVDVYCACSESAAYWKFTPRYQQQTHIIHNGIKSEVFRFDPVMREKMRKKMDIPDWSFVIGHVGRLSKEKNQQILIHILKNVVERGVDARLLLVGDGQDQDMLYRLAVKLGVDSRLQMIGHTGQVQNYLQAMDVFVFPSIFESFGIAAVEAQASGLPVVASDQLPKEVRITKNFRYISLNESISVWTDAVLSFQGAERQDQTDKVRKAGFDISFTLQQLEKIYCG